MIFQIKHAFGIYWASAHVSTSETGAANWRRNFLRGISQKKKFCAVTFKIQCGTCIGPIIHQSPKLCSIFAIVFQPTARASPANTKTYWRNATKLGDVYCRVLFRDSMCARDVCALENRFGKFLQFKVRKKVYI